MTAPSQPPARSPDISWPLLLAVWLAVMGALALLAHNVYYTEGEMAERGFVVLIGTLAIVSLLLGFRRRRLAIWCVVLFGGALLLWQCAQTRKWALIHEDTVGIVRLAEKTKRETGSYPANLDGYDFQHPWVRDHIVSFKKLGEGEILMSYFMNDASITYWYSSKNGFSYYAD